MKKQKQLSAEEAKRIGDSLYIDWDQVDLEQFRKGLMGNHKQGSIDPVTELTYDGMLLSGKVVLTHMEQFPDYFNRLEKIKTEIDEYHARRWYIKQEQT